MAVTAPYSNLASTFLNSQYGNVFQDADGNWWSTTSGGGGEGGPGPDQTVPLQNLMTPDDWARFQGELQGGVLGYTPGATQQSGGEGGPTTSQTSGLFTADESKLPKNVFGGPGNVGLIGAGFNDPNAPPTQDQWGGITDRSKLRWDPNYGWVTGITNITHDKEPWYEKAIDFTGNMAPTAIMAAMAAVTMNPELLGAMYAGGGLGALSGAFNAAGGALTTGKIDPLSVAGATAGAFGVPSWMTSAATQAINASQGKPINPLAIGGTAAGALGFSPSSFLSANNSSVNTPSTGGGMDFFDEFTNPNIPIPGIDPSAGFDYGSSGPFDNPGGTFSAPTYGMIDNGNGTFTDPATGAIYDQNGISTGETDPMYGDPNNTLGGGDGSGGGGGGGAGGGGGGAGGGGTTSPSGGFNLPFGLTPGQLAALGLGAGGILAGVHGANTAANTVTQAADRQAQANLDLAKQQNLLNNPNMVTPYGTSTYTIGPDGRPILTQQLSPNEQAKLVGSQQLQLGQLGIANQLGLPRIADLFSKPFGMPGAVPTASEADRQQAQNAAYRNVTQYLDPQFQQSQEQLQTQLANQGIYPPTTAAEQNDPNNPYNRAMLNFNNTKQKAYADARDQAVRQGLAAEQTQFGMQMQGRQQGFNEYTTGQTMPISQLNAMLTGSQVNNPQFQPTQPTQIQPSPYFQAGVANANIGQGTQQNLFNVVGRLGSAYLNQPTAPSPTGGY